MTDRADKALREALRVLLDYTKQLELLVYDELICRETTHDAVALAEAALKAAAPEEENNVR